MLKMNILSWIINPAHMTSDAQNMHREKSAVKENESADEMNLAEEVIEFATEHFREPIINSGESGKHAAAEKNIVNVGHNKIRIVNENINGS